MKQNEEIKPELLQKIVLIHELLRIIYSIPTKSDIERMDRQIELLEKYPEWESGTSYTGREKVMYNGKVCYPSSQIGK